MKLPIRAGETLGFPSIIDADGVTIASCVNPDALPRIVAAVNAVPAILHELAHMDPEEDNVKALAWLIDRARSVLGEDTREKLLDTRAEDVLRPLHFGYMWAVEQYGVGLLNGKHIRTTCLSAVLDFIRSGGQDCDELQETDVTVRDWLNRAPQFKLGDGELE